MSIIDTEYQEAKQCAICNSKTGVHVRDARKIFNKEIKLSAALALQQLISKTLENIPNNSSALVDLCNKCYKLFEEMHELHKKMMGITTNIVHNFNKASHSANHEITDNDSTKENTDIAINFDMPSDDDLLQNMTKCDKKASVDPIDAIDIQFSRINGQFENVLNKDTADSNLDDSNPPLYGFGNDKSDKNSAFIINEVHEEQTTNDSVEPRDNTAFAILSESGVHPTKYIRSQNQIMKATNDNQVINLEIELKTEQDCTTSIEDESSAVAHFQMIEETEGSASPSENLLESVEEINEVNESTTIVMEDANCEGETLSAGILRYKVRVPKTGFNSINAASNNSEMGVSSVENITLIADTDVENDTQMSSPLIEDDQSRIKLEIPDSAQLVTRDGDMYTCLICEGDHTVCGVAKAMAQHMRSAHDARIYFCDVCGDDFRKRPQLSLHMDDHVAQEEGDFQCETCNRIFTNLRLFRIHRRMHYPQNKAWTCDVCEKKYSSRNLLEEHMNVHTGTRPYICGLCGKDFASKYTFKAHEKTHEVRPRPFSCLMCGKSFLSQQNLNQHERTHTGLKEFSCHLCDKRFGSAHNLEVHSIVHTGFKPYRCGMCGKSFARKAEIKDHERTHTGERPFQCEMCGATFSQRSNLSSHKRATHFDDKRYKCQTCGKGYKRQRLLDYHIKAIHTGERPFKCLVCEATFVYPEHFKKHRLIHTGEKPFLCEVCGKAFASRDNRNAHRFIHSDKKPYECLVCGNGFMRKPQLYQHMQSSGHLNDTIVVNQPRLTTQNNQILRVNVNGEMEIVDANQMRRLETIPVNAIGEDSKLFITNHMLVDGKILDTEDGTLILDDDDEDDAVEHIIINGEQIQFADAIAIEDDDEMIEIDEEEIDHLADGNSMDVTEVHKEPKIKTELITTHLTSQSSTSLASTGKLTVKKFPDVGILRPRKRPTTSQRFSRGITFHPQQILTGVLESNSSTAIAATLDDSSSSIVEVEEFNGIIAPNDLHSNQATQIIHTQDGALQLVAVRIPNEDGEEEEAWIKIVPDPQTIAIETD